MKLFHHELAFSPIDPDDNGVRDDIDAEQREPDAFASSFYEDADGNILAERWSEVLEAAHQEADGSGE